MSNRLKEEFDEKKEEPLLEGLFRLPWDRPCKRSGRQLVSQDGI